MANSKAVQRIRKKIGFTAEDTIKIIPNKEDNRIIEALPPDISAEKLAKAIAQIAPEVVLKELPEPVVQVAPVIPINNPIDVLTPAMAAGKLPVDKKESYKAVWTLINSYQASLPLEAKTVATILKTLSPSSFNFTADADKIRLLDGLNTLLIQETIKKVAGFKQTFNLAENLTAQAIMKLELSALIALNVNLTKLTLQPPALVMSAAQAACVTELKEKLTAYIEGVAKHLLREGSDTDVSFKTDFMHGFSMMAVSRGLNREVNIEIAKALLLELEKPGVCVDTLFSPGSIQAIKDGIMSTDHFKKHPTMDSGIHSTPLNAIINLARHPVTETAKDNGLAIVKSFFTRS